MSNTRTITIRHEGKNYDGQIATIRSTSLGYEDHGIFTVMLNCVWPGGGVGVGGFCLDESMGKDGDYKRRGTAYGLDHIIRVMETVGVSSWEQLVGKHVIVLSDEGHSGWGGVSVGIAHATEDRVLILKEHAEAWRAERTPQDAS